MSDDVNEDRRAGPSNELLNQKLDQVHDVVVGMDRRINGRLGKVETRLTELESDRIRRDERLRIEAEHRAGSRTTADAALLAERVEPAAASTSVEMRVLQVFVALSSIIGLLVVLQKAL